MIDTTRVHNTLLPTGYPHQRPRFTLNAVDLHVHSGPDCIDRIGTSIDIAKASTTAGMKAIVLKDHLFPSYTKAVLTDQIVPDIRIFGGITMNGTAGGIAVRPVAAALAGGARVVMFPTFDSLRYVEKSQPSRIQTAHSFGQDVAPIRAVSDGTLLRGTEGVLEVVAAHPQTILSSGHLGPEEIVPVMERAAELGIDKKVIEHPNANTWFSPDDYRRLVDLGVKFNMSYNAYHPMISGRSFDELLTLLDAVGPEHCNLITDGGQPYSPMPAVLLQVFCEMLHFRGLSVEEIKLMTQANPSSLLGL